MTTENFELAKHRRVGRVELEVEVVLKFHPIRHRLAVLYGRLKLNSLSRVYRSFGESIGQSRNDETVLHFSGRRKDTPQNNGAFNPILSGPNGIFRFGLAFHNRAFVHFFAISVDTFFFTLNIFCFGALGVRGMCRRQNPNPSAIQHTQV